MACIVCGGVRAVQAQSAPVEAQPVIEALRAHDNARALALCREIERRSPPDVRLLTLEGLALNGLGRRADALSALARALELDPAYPAALEAAAQIEFKADPPKARPYLERLIRKNPRDSTAQAMLGAIAFGQRDCTSAVAHFEQGRGALANNVLALEEFGACLVNLGRAAESVPVFERILALRPADWKARYNLGLVQYRAHHGREAVQTLLPLTNNPDAKTGALNLIAAVYEAGGQTPKAVVALRQAIALAPRDPGNYLDLATLCLDHGSFGVGIDVLKAGVRVLPGSSALYTELGVLLVQTGRFDEADDAFRRAEALRPAQNYSTVALGISLLEENRARPALNLVKQRLQTSPRDPVLNYLLAEILVRQGAQPGTPPFRDAVAAAERAVQGKRGFVPALDVLAELELRSGHIGRAERASRAALESDPQDQSALYHLVVCARRQHDLATAKQLAARLARVSEAAQEQAEERTRFRLVEEKR